MKRILFTVCLAIGICAGNIANAQLAPGGEFKTTYTKELKNLESQLNKGDDAGAGRTLLMLMQMQEKHKRQLETLIKKTEDKEDVQDIADRIEVEQERATKLKELSGEILANKQEIMQEMNDFLKEE